MSLQRSLINFHFHPGNPGTPQSVKIVTANVPQIRKVTTACSLPLAASPLARVLSRDSLLSPKYESLLAGYKTDFSLTSANKPQSSLVLYLPRFELNRDRKTRCTNSWSNLTLKYNANTFVKVDARIEENCRRTISYLQGYSCLKLHCKKLSNEKHTANTVRYTRRTTLR